MEDSSDSDIKTDSDMDCDVDSNVESDSDSDLDSDADSDGETNQCKQSKNERKKILHKIAKVLQQDPHPKSFCKTEDLKPNDLHIKVERVGLLELPLQQNQIKQLLKISTKAKFGKRSKTILDESVRNTSMIDSNKLKVTIDQDIFSSMLKKMRKGLGLSEDTSLIPHIHNMLVYGPGQFFDFHQDSEKLDDMVATLVIVLPYPHIGGNLIIKNKMHSENKFVFSSQNISNKVVKCVAFYSDCLHKVEEVSDGYRVVLTYNLVLQSNSTEEEIMKLAATNMQLKLLVSKYFSMESNVDTLQLAYFLDHQYTEKNFKLNKLKGADASNVIAFYNVAKQLDLSFHVALVEISEHFYIEEDQRMAKGYKYSVRDEDWLDEDMKNRCISVSHWIDKDNNIVPFGTLELDEKYDVCQTKDTSTFKP